MIRLMNRKPRTAKMVKRKPRFATIILDPKDAAKDRKMSIEDARLLWDQQKLQMLDIGQGYGAAFGPPRTWRQMIHEQMPAPHPDVLAACAKYENANPEKDSTNA